jgi:hypothetical protein
LSALDREGFSVAVMQSNDDFTIGGSISVNCHGWQSNSPPIASTVESFKILLADGSVRECRRQSREDRELFAAVCGGYGLFGVILEAELRVVPNALYRAEEFSAKAENFAERFDTLIVQSAGLGGLAYGRVSIAPGPGSFEMHGLFGSWPRSQKRRQERSQTRWIRSVILLRNHGRSTLRARLFAPPWAVTLESSDDGRLSECTDKPIALCRAMEF